MLTSLNIKNFALIKSQNLSFTRGFNVLIGETGAGKSLIIDAINFVLGAKPDKSLIRTNEQTLSVKATFSDINNTTKQILTEYLIDFDDVLIIARSFNIEGKSMCQINGENVTVGMLKTIAESLVDSYGQHENIELLKVKNHIRMLDQHCNKKMIDALKQEIKLNLEKLLTINEEIKSLGGTKENRENMIDLLSYQITEIENAKLKQGEDEELKEQLLLMHNSEKITSSVSNAVTMLSGMQLASALSSLSSATKFDSKLEDVYERIKSLEIECDDVLSELNNYAETLYFSESDMLKLDSRLDQIKLLKKKYGAEIQDIYNFLENAKANLESLVNADEKLIKLQNQQLQQKCVLFDYCLKLHELRVKTAKQIEVQICNELVSLGMKNARFKVEFKDVSDINFCTFTNDGVDEVEFLFSANTGEELKSLAKTISGGEMSRFMLAVKNILANPDTISTLIFDEIDSGVSGEIGSMVAKRIANLSKMYQVICITHMPQVTAMADNYIYVQKCVLENQTISQTEILNSEQIFNYLAKLSGQGITEASLNNANELKTWAESYKQSLNK